MSEFATWYIEFIQTVFEYVASFFATIFNAFYYALWVNPSNMLDSFVNASMNFNALDWIIGILILIINFIFIVSLAYFIIVLLRRYFRFVKKEVSKDDLLIEITELNQKLIDVTDEKNAILTLKSSDLGLPMNRRSVTGTLAKLNEEEDEKLEEQTSRFTKLIAVDETYHMQVLQTNMTESDMLNLNQLVDRFINFAASQLKLFYSPKIVSIFFAGMGSSKIIILEGISGTGKTSLPYSMGKFFNNDTSIISVQPSWRDRAEMIGYLNEFTKKFNETDFLKSIYEATYRTDLNFIVLDEMNLARVEYYFADFLSILEMPNTSEWEIDITSDTVPGDPIHLKEGKLLLPPNIWFIGTANRDDSTFAITDKVYDRAASIELSVRADYIDAPFTDSIHVTHDYMDALFKEAVKMNPISQKSLENLKKIDEFITQNFQITFGNRIMKQINTFVPIFVACGQSEVDGLDYIITRKVLRKFEFLNLPFLRKELDELIALIDKLFGKQSFTEARNMINNYKKQM
ncbi:hypothetical protein [Acholeplasma laidlawii]|uniref:ATPase dynein-related AAA domain-containing protein n=2 Tax=Acholeplasma laidlawii TaxID=2148 RepID=A0A553IH93_ACHLA|nr:hypothetical protein [Acholeplasma laidlawii]ABX81619.1 hypothetical surface-anchored protein [Acholeplasma laidlawii PG-8A]NWH11197.1 hypothetical protein [Acholeplasma laidlawii]NWH13392.1 hypothetical protein [Acholeplasma laidlawii]NWH14059.1 hypothetical protein [Acholeplasma laidlawii]OAN20402.1 hypothetical protein A2I99_01765 [Acholeplasma laidlawii]